MKPPTSIAGANGDVYMQANQRTLNEFGVVEEGNQVSCSVLASPGDNITVSFSVDCGIKEVVDIVVDGVSRGSQENFNDAKRHRHTFNVVCHNPRKYPGDPRRTGKAGLKLYKMQIKERNTENDINVPETDELSSVGTIELRFYRKNGQSNDDGGHLQRGPNFNDYPVWSDLNAKIGSGRPAPAFEIGFVDPADGNFSRHKTRVVRELSAKYRLWASFKFVLRSEAELQSMGFIEETIASQSGPAPGTSQHENQAGSSNSSTPVLNQDNDMFIPETQRDVQQKKEQKEEEEGQSSTLQNLPSSTPGDMTKEKVIPDSQESLGSQSQSQASVPAEKIIPDSESESQPQLQALVSASQATTASYTSSQEAELANTNMPTSQHAGEKRKANMISDDNTMSAPPSLESHNSTVPPATQGGSKTESASTNSVGPGISKTDSPPGQESKGPAPAMDPQNAQRLAAETHARLEQEKLAALPEVERQKRIAHERYANAICERNRLKEELEDALLEHHNQAEIRELNAQAEKLESECSVLKAKIAALREKAL